MTPAGARGLAREHCFFCTLCLYNVSSSRASLERGLNFIHRKGLYTLKHVVGLFVLFKAQAASTPIESITFPKRQQFQDFSELDTDWSRITSTYVLLEQTRIDENQCGADEINVWTLGGFSDGNLRSSLLYLLLLISSCLTWVG